VQGPAKKEDWECHNKKVQFEELIIICTIMSTNLLTIQLEEEDLVATS
jgi:hypothetical protein